MLEGNVEQVKNILRKLRFILDGPLRPACTSLKDPDVTQMGFLDKFRAFKQLESIP